MQLLVSLNHSASLFKKDSEWWHLLLFSIPYMYSPFLVNVGFNWKLVFIVIKFSHIDSDGSCHLMQSFCSGPAYTKCILFLGNLQTNLWNKMAPSSIHILLIKAVATNPNVFIAKKKIKSWLWFFISGKLANICLWKGDILDYSRKLRSHGTEEY